VDLIAASGCGVLLAIMLFVRQQLGSPVVARKSEGSHISSKRVRTTAEMKFLESQGTQTVVFELHGSLFFGTADKLFLALEPELATRTYIVLDMRRVQAVDVTAAHVLSQVQERLSERGAMLLFSEAPPTGLGGRDLRRYFQDVSEGPAQHGVRFFEELDGAVEWIEDQLIARAQLATTQESALELQEMELFAKRNTDTVAELLACMEPRSYKAGERIFAGGDTGDEIFLIRRGTVRIQLPRSDGGHLHLASFGRGGFFGEMAFIDHQTRSADAVAFSDCDLYILSRSRFDALTEHHKKLGLNVMEALARLLAARLRHVNAELSALQAS
jgi:SulP family sulfate permease